MEYVLLRDRLRDFDILSRLLGRDVINDIEMTYISKKDIGKLDVDVNKAMLKLKCTDEDLELLDTYYDCPLSHKRILIYVDDTYISWVYVRNKSETTVGKRGKWQ